MDAWLKKFLVEDLDLKKSIKYKGCRIQATQGGFVIWTFDEDEKEWWQHGSSATTGLPNFYMTLKDAKEEIDNDFS